MVGMTALVEPRPILGGLWRFGETLAPCGDVDGGPVTAQVEHARGAFALTWTDPDGRLVLARDPIGHRSLYWSRLANGQVAWSTRLANVARHLPTRNLALNALAAYLACSYVPGSSTLLAEVRAVPAGALLRFGASGPPEVERFWSLPRAPESFDSEGALLHRLRDSLQATVARVTPPERTAAFLSGGIDSSLVVALARQQVTVDALSIHFGPEHRDELPWSRAVCEHTGARHHAVHIGPDDVRRELDATVAALSEPNGDPLTVPNRVLFRTAAEMGHTVVLNGEGGDPCFGGPKNAPMLLAEVYGPDHRSEGLAHAYVRAHQRLADDLDLALEPAVAAAIPADAVTAKVTPWLDDVRWPALLDRLMAINVAWKGAGHILPKVEHLGGLSGVSARSPLFDVGVVELAFQIPGELKRKGAIEKYLLKEAVRPWLPSAVVDRPKSGMMVPVEAWFDGPLRAFARERLLEGLAPRRLFRRSWLEALVDRRLGGLRPRRGVKLWLLLTLEAWLRAHLPDGPLA